MLPLTIANASIPTRSMQASWDHPRVCGEHSEDTWPSCRASGSSPRVRGARCNRAGQNARGRIIPACAGSTSSAGPPRSSGRDHPRVCGEHRLSRFVLTFGSGSSPRVRGARAHDHRNGQGGGIIPACAGSTGARRTAAIFAKDHPRVCGEHDNDSGGFWVEIGSSPRVRGARKFVVVIILGPGIIPACAGSTVRIAAISRPGRDHPRVCGEHSHFT